MTAASSEYVMVRYEKIKYVSIGVHDIAAGTRHEHGVLEVGVVLDGAVRVCCQSGTFDVQVGGLLLFSAYEPHTVTSISEKPARVLSVWVSGYFGREYFARIPNTVFDSTALYTTDTSALRQLLLDAADSYFREPEAFQLECVGTVSLLVTALFRLLPHKQNTEAESAIKKKKLGRMRRISVYIEQHYKQKLTMSELAKAEGVTTAYMSRVFRELFHMSFQEYLNLLRLERAIPLMRDPSLYLVDICMECGFSDTRYLNAVCQKEFGCNATTYRKEHLHRGMSPLEEKLQKGCTEPKYSDEDSLKLLQKFRKEHGC